MFFFQHLKKQKSEGPVDKCNIPHGGAEVREREGNTWALAAFSKTRNCIRSERGQTCSFGIRTDGGYEQHFRRCHCLPWLTLPCGLWADIPRIIIHNPATEHSRTAWHSQTHSMFCGHCGDRSKGTQLWAKEHKTHTFRVYPVCVDWLYNTSQLQRLHLASEGGKIWRFTTPGSLINIIFFSGSDLTECKINSSYDSQMWPLVRYSVHRLRSNWILTLNLRGRFLSISLRALFHSSSLNIYESGFDFLLV